MDEPNGRRFGLSRVTLADKHLFDTAFSTLRQPTSDYSFANTFIWSASLDLYWRVMENHLCVFANGTGDLTMLMAPVPLPSATEQMLGPCLAQCFAIMDDYNAIVSQRERSRVEYVSDELLERVSSLRGISLSATPMSGDYVYSTQSMIDLAGGALKSKRHARSKFMRDFPNHRTCALTSEHIEPCLALLDLWCDHGDESHEGEVNDSHVGSDILRHRESLACRRALTNWQELGLTGMVLLVDETIIGFTLGEPLSPQQCTILVEKTHPDYHGAAQFIFSEFCRQYWSSYPETNASDDWGIPSLRFTKQSYRPIKLLSKYTLTRQAVPVEAGINPAELPAENPAHFVVASNTIPMRAEMSGDAPTLLRTAHRDDVEGILQLERVSFENVAESFNRRQVRALIRNPRALVCVAQREGKIAGWCVGLVRQHRHTRSGRIYAVAVHPEARGQKLGRQLVQQMMQKIAQQNITRVFLEVREGNDTAIALYRKLGFADHRELPNYYGVGVHGRRMKCVITAQIENEAPAPAMKTSYGENCLRNVSS